MTHEIHAGLSIIGHISLHDHTIFQAPSLRNTITNRPTQLVLATDDREVCQGDFVRIACHYSRHAKEAGIHAVVSNVQFVIAAIVEVIPMKLWIGGF